MQEQTSFSLSLKKKIYGLNNSSWPHQVAGWKSPQHPHQKLQQKTENEGSNL